MACICLIVCKEITEWLHTSINFICYLCKVEGSNRVCKQRTLIAYSACKLIEPDVVDTINGQPLFLFDLSFGLKN